jgi:hypothetical protein
MILAIIATGSQAGLVGKRSPLLTITLVLAFSAVILLIADLDSELKRWLNVSQQAMIDLQEKMNLPGQ